MKLLFCLLIATTLQAQVIVPDIITENSEQRLSTEEIKAEKKNFLDFITKYRNSEFVGHTQYVLSSLNLSIRANVKYSVELDGSVLFQMASDGNRHIRVSDVTFPMQGSVFFELRNAEGHLVSFETEDNLKVEFPARKNMFYILETENSFNVRKNVQAKFIRGEKPVGRFLAIVRYDLFTQDIEFYETLSGKLLRRGSFNGNAAPSRRGW